MVCFFALRNADFIFQAAQCFLAGFLIYKGNDVLCKVKNPVQVAAGDIQQHAEVGRDTAGIPDMGNRGCQVDMPHPFTAYSRAGYFHTAFVADNTFIAGIFVFTAVALPVTGRAKNCFTE